MKILIAYIECAIFGMLAGCGIIFLFGLWGLLVMVPVSAFHVWAAKTLLNADLENRESKEGK